MTNEELFPGIQKCIAGALQIDPSAITPTSTQDELEQWDSLGHLSIILAVEDEFDVSLQMEDIPLMTSVALITKYVEEAKAA